LEIKEKPKEKGGKKEKRERSETGKEGKGGKKRKGKRKTEREVEKKEKKKEKQKEKKRRGGLTEVVGDKLQCRGDDGGVEGLQGEREEQPEDDFEAVLAAALLFGSLFRSFFGFWFRGVRALCCVLKRGRIGGSEALRRSREDSRVVGLGPIRARWSRGCWLFRLRLLPSLVLFLCVFVGQIHRAVASTEQL
jgi:hypothetical protein